MSLIRKLSKAFRAIGNPRAFKALRSGVAASYEHEALLRGLGPLKTIVDVGANVGQFALLSSLVQPNARIYSFEPMAGPAETYTSVLGDDPKVTLHRYALGAEENALKINVTARLDSSSLLEPGMQTEVFPGTHKVGNETVQVAPLSKIVPGDQISGPALLKIDVQGFEGEVLRGCTDVLGQFDWILCEMSFVELYKGQPLAHELIPWLAEQGFTVASVSTDPLMERNGRMVQADFLFRNDTARIQL
ncbi:MAG: FkbM family methyltransferase [Pseudomonadota bacterium]